MRRSAEAILALPLFLPLLATSTSAQGPTWCGKVYLPNETIVAPTGQFPTPASSTTPLLALRCQPALIPFLPEDSTSAQIIVDALQVYQQWPDAQPYDTTGGGSGANVSVVATIDGKQVAAGSVALNGTVLLSAPLQGLTPRSEPYNLTCTGTVGSQKFTSSSNLTYLPSPPPNIGSVTKRDLLSGGLKARKSSAQDYELVFPVGFYTTWAGYLEANESTVDTISADGLNLIHPVPSFDNRTALNVTVAKMEELDIWLMYDMRNTYKDLSAVRSETTPLQSRTNLLLYYTADEPDGTSDSPNATLAAYDLLRDLDPYRPTSLVLNCADYRWTEYASAAEILLQDVYNIGNDLSWSSVYNTSCTTEHGVCGCDDCQGGWADISGRVQSFRDRSRIMGWDRTKSVWTVPQGFGSAEFWNVTPTGAEWMAEAIVGINAGARGVVSWIDPTTADIKSAASTLARAASSLAPHLFLSSPDAKQLTLSDPTYNIGLYFNPSNGSTLVLATSLVDSPVNVSVSDILTQASLFGSNAKVEAQNLQVIMDGGASVRDGNFVFEKMQSGAWVMQSQVSSTNSSSALRTLGLEAGVGVVAILVSMVLYFLS